MPSTPYEAKGLLVASIRDDNPVVFIDERWLYECQGEVPEEVYSIPLGEGVVRRQGGDVTVIATSYMVTQALRAAETLEKEGVDAEVIDPRSLKPLDEKLLLDSVKKTGRLVIADAGWRTCGIGAEIAALAAEKAFGYLKSPVMRVSLPDAPAPAGASLEEAYYPGPADIVAAAKKLLEGN